MPSHKLRIVYMGTPDFAVLPLKRIIEAGFQVVGVVTNPDKPAGRGQQLQESAVKIRPGNRPEDSATREIQGSRFFTGAGRAKSRFAISCGI